MAGNREGWGLGLMAGQAEDIPLDPATLVRLATVVSVDLAEARCTVQIGDEDSDDSISPPVRWGGMRCGKTRIWSPPSVGEQGELHCPDGEIENAIFYPGIVCDAFPPVGSDETEIIEFEDGSRVSYDPVGHAFEINLSDGATARIVAPGGLTIDADVTINGDIDLQGKMTATDDVIADGKSLKSHKHSGVQAGGGQTGTPV